MQDVKSLITELMCVKSKGETSCAQRFESFSELLRIAKERPELVYPYCDEIATKLFSPENTHRFHGIDIIPCLATVDKDNKIIKIIDKYISLLEDPSFVIAMHAAAGLGFIAKAKPELETKITNALLMLDYEKTKHPNLLRSVAVGSFMQYKPRVRQVTEFVEKLVNSDSPKARKLAKEYLKVARNGTQ